MLEEPEGKRKHDAAPAQNTLSPDESGFPLLPHPFPARGLCIGQRSSAFRFQWAEVDR